jgi:GNAT superfamily N-acetyltransferase
VQVGPFLATFTPHNDNPFLNYAIPDDGAAPTLSDVRELIAAYRDHDRKPRLEYIPEVAPAVEELLLAAGFAPEGRLPLMVVDSESLRIPVVRASVNLSAPETDDELFGMIAVQAEAYEDPRSASLDEVKRRRAALEGGSLAVIAKDIESGEVVGAGSCSPIEAGLTEVAGIGVAKAYRRQGIAKALAHWLAKEALALGAPNPWLMAEHEAETNVYKQIGFSTIGTVLLISH